ncbi:class I SAM-dependent methyltransferase [Labedella populi]|uniref:Class I SAM-dependent methyltransferase n=1 Tax=Labedella populi TaxID=2498850 RepID=A0A444QES7_9MICO|nr:class I SAM-dependent methyltransferase [Labedella populi]RWZ68082.1 class I SAM-dependent methyltransferase [Labedella populi]
MPSDVQTSYSKRAEEYTTLFGSMESVHPSDVQLVTAWAGQIDGPILDAGCGPGHWTGYLAEKGHDSRGVDHVRAFIAHAREVHPGVPFDVGSIDVLPDAPGSLGGVLAWYSLIHHKPATIARPLGEFARVLRPGGGLLLGFFTGPAVEPFEHAVVGAYRWPPEVLAEEVRRAGFEVVEIHTRTGAAPKPRPHGAILARLRVTGR